MSELNRWLTSSLGWTPIHHRDVSWAHAASDVRLLVGAGGERAYLKVHRHARKFNQERAALRAWGAQLAGSAQLLGWRTSPSHALLLAALPGVLVAGAALHATTLQRVHHAAGSWLQRLHTLAYIDRDPLPLEGALRQRLRHAAQRAAAVVPARTVAWVVAKVAAADLQPLQRVPCHRDYTPRNWLWHPEQGLGVIDFEHAHPDLWWADVGRLSDEAWVTQPALEAAFWEGYGRTPSAQERQLGEAYRAMAALSTISWACAHADALFEAQGWAVLERLGAPR